MTVTTERKAKVYNARKKKTKIFLVQFLIINQPL